MGRDGRSGSTADEGDRDAARPAGGTPDGRGQTAESDAQGKVAPKADERPPDEQRAEADLLKASGGDPFTQESD